MQRSFANCNDIIIKESATAEIIVSTLARGLKVSGSNDEIFGYLGTSEA